MDRHLTFEDFRDLVGASFALCDDAGAAQVELRLAEATALPARNGIPGGRPPFSLIFSGPLDRFAPQGLYLLKNDSFGEATLFMVPVGQTAEGFSYQALFN